MGKHPAYAVAGSQERVVGSGDEELKPIEIIKLSLSSYLAHSYREDRKQAAMAAGRVESSDAMGLRRGNQSAIDRLLFNVNYWRAAYEQRIVAACLHPENAKKCLQVISVWNNHTLRLNTLSPDEVINIFERFCPPFAANNRRGSKRQGMTGKGPLPDFARMIATFAETGAEPQENLDELRAIYADMEAEAAVYDALNPSGALSALFTILPAWCLQNRIELVTGTWWDDYQTMTSIIDALYNRFMELGFSETICRYFLDSSLEALDAYYRDLASDLTPFSSLEIPALIAAVEDARETHPNFETDGYGKTMPSWLISKEQLIWNIFVCALYGPATARPLLVDSPDLLSSEGYTSKTDIITELARTSFLRYTSDRVASQTDLEYSTFASLPLDLRDSSIAYINSIYDKIKTLGYEVLPMGTCYPERRVSAFTASEVECLAILEHRRWLRERQQAGWEYGVIKDVEKRQSPYITPWEELPDRAKEWNRSAVRSIPNLLASVNLAVVK